MKRLIILLTIIPALVFAVEPERILPKTLVIKELDDLLVSGSER